MKRHRAQMPPMGIPILGHGAHAPKQIDPATVSYDQVGDAAILPQHDLVLLESLTVENERKTLGGIYIPDSVKETADTRWRVVAIGPGRLTTAGELVPIPLKPGDLVMYCQSFGRFVPLEVKQGHSRRILVGYETIMCIVVPKETATA